MVTDALQYQRLSKRYIPEVMNYVLNALCILVPTPPDVVLGNFPRHEPASSLRLQSAVVGDVRPLQFWDILPKELSIDEQSQLKSALIEAHITLMDSAAELWAGKPAFYEVFEPTLKVLQLFLRKECGKWLPLSTKVSPGREYIPAPELLLTPNSKKVSRRPKNSSAS
jgi:nucleolar protein 14